VRLDDRLSSSTASIQPSGPPEVQPVIGVRAAPGLVRCLGKEHAGGVCRGRREVWTD
jgi:hypothetical protein